jgi:hypothetical protein
MSDLLIRIHAETLALNLQLVRDTFHSLPGLTEAVKKITADIEAIRGNAQQITSTMGSLKAKVRERQLPPSKELRELGSSAEEAADGIGDQCDAVLKDLQAIEKGSLLAQMQESGLNISEWLRLPLDNLTTAVNSVRDGIGVAAKRAETWHQFAQVKRKANDDLFNESIELLDGIALRDRQLGSNICELAEALIKSIYRTDTRTAHTIPGGVATMMMRSERIVRLPFPGWNIWALPLVAQEFWQGVLKREHNALTSIQEATAPIRKVLGPETTDRCLGDVFATYSLGPAYAYAAITLLFDPIRLEDEARVAAILATLAMMDPAEDKDLSKPVTSGRSYLNEARRLRAEWAEARDAAFAALALDSFSVTAHQQVLRDLNPSPGSAEGQAYRQKIDELQMAWKAAAGHASAPANRIDKARLVPLVSTMFQALATREFPSLSMGPWMQLEPLRDVLARTGSAKVDEAASAGAELAAVDVAGCDIRHVLNAAWTVRVEGSLSFGDAFTRAALALAMQIRNVPETENRKRDSPGAPQ